MFKVKSVKLVNNGGNLVAIVSCSYGELDEINEFAVFQNGNKLQVNWPKQRPSPKGNYSKWVPIVVPSEKLKKEVEPLILSAVKEEIGDAGVRSQRIPFARQSILKGPQRFGPLGS